MATLSRLVPDSGLRSCFKHAARFAAVLTISWSAIHAQTETKRLRVGVLVDNYPFSYRTADGKMEGFSVDLLAEIERTMALQLERHMGTTAEINIAFEQGRLDMLQTYVRSEHRESFALFSRPYVDMAGSIFVRKDAPKISSIAELRNKRVMVHRGSRGEQLLRAAGLADSIVHVSSVEESLRLLNAGENDAALVARWTGLANAHRLGLRNIHAVGPSAYESDYCFAVRREHSEVLARIDEGLLIARQPGGAYEKLYRKWLGELGGYSRRDVMLAITVGLALSLLVALWAIFRGYKLRLRIKRQAADLKISEERYRSVFENTLDAMFVLAPAANARGELLVEQANPSALRLADLHALPPPPLRLNSVLPKDPELCASIEARVAKGTPDVFEHERSAGSMPRWLRVTVGPIGSRKLVVLADITEAKQTEIRLRKHDQLLRQHQKLEAIGTMASGIAHDFNNILTGIIGNAELAKLDIADNHPCAQPLGEILAGSDRAKKLVRQILTFSRQQETRREIIHAGKIVHETLNFLRATLPKTIDIHYECDSVPPAEIEVDPTQLHQVVVNLCTNAVHAMRDKPGQIEIREDCVDIHGEDMSQHGKLKPGRYVHLSFRDTGCGMSPETLQRLFEPFFTTKGPGEGTGLGLSVVHGIVRSSGGDITVFSQIGRGTVFHLYFPVAKAAAKETSNDVILRGNGQRILFVDDEPAVVDVTRRMLEKIGYNVMAFTNPIEAVEAHRRDPGAFAAVICDLTMPEMTGLELAERLGCPKPFLLVSGYVSDRDRTRANELKIARVISKPVNLSKLAQALADCLCSDRR